MQIYIQMPITEEHQIYICNVIENARNNNNIIQYKMIM